MLSKLLALLRRYDMVQPGDRVICALSGGADSVALTFGLYLLKDKLSITVEAAHFNHHLRGEESQRDEYFVKAFCDRLDIPLHLGQGSIQPGKKGLEAAAREARYGFFDTLPGKIATAHTCDDNAETVLMHLVRGTGLKGLGGIAPVRGKFIRPMLEVSRQEVEAFLSEYHLSHVTDSTNLEDGFLRNRLRHQVLPLLRQENPAFAKNTSAMALRLRQEEQTLESLTEGELPPVQTLRALPEALRRRYLAEFLKRQGVKEPEAKHILLAESLVFSQNPSARGCFPGGVTIGRCYDALIPISQPSGDYRMELEETGEYLLPEAGLSLRISPAEQFQSSPDAFTVPAGRLCLRNRRTGDRMTASGGSKTLKKLYIDEKIPTHLRICAPVVVSGELVLGAWGLGANIALRDREPRWLLEFTPLSPSK